MPDIELQDITAEAVQAGDVAWGNRATTAKRFTLGTAAGAATGDFATAAQGALADTAVQPARTITAGTGLSGGGDLSANRTLSLADTAVTAGAYGSASAVATFTVDAQGRLTAAGSTAIAISAAAVSGLATVATTGVYGDLSGTPGDFAGSAAGLVPAPGAGDAARYLRADGTWDDIPAGGSVAYGDLTSIPAAIDAIDGLTPAADRVAYYSGASTAALATFSAFGRSLVDDADAAAARTTLGLGTMATQSAASVSINGGSISGIADLAVADGGTGASTAAGARTNLGLVIGTDVAPMTVFTAVGAGLVPGSGGGTTNFLRADGTWAAPAGGGTVTSVAISGSDGIEVDSGSPITGAGTIALGIDAAALRAHLNVANGATANTGTVTSVAISGSDGITVLSGSPITGAGTISLGIANGGLSLSKLVNQAQGTLIGRGAGAGSGAPSALTPAQVRTLLNVADGAQANIYASAAEARAGTEGAKAIAPDVAYSAMAPVALSDGATITPDLRAGRVFTVTLGGNRTLASPTNQVAGQSGLIVVSQDGTGSRTLSYGTAWKFPGGAPTLSTAANAKDVIAYYVQASGTILCNITKAYS